jgi:hypothetical protein
MSWSSPWNSVGLCLSYKGLPWNHREGSSFIHGGSSWNLGGQIGRVNALIRVVEALPVIIDVHSRAMGSHPEEVKGLTNN